MTETAMEPSAGEWVMPAVSYVEPMRVYCALCGRPIARRHWRAAPAGERLPFCDPDHAALYRTYWIPTYVSDPSS
jgi:hypothetical protein